jgi:hypothetical protein
VRLCGNIRRGEGPSGRGREEVVLFQITCPNFFMRDLYIISIIRVSQIRTAQNCLEVHMK